MEQMTKQEYEDFTKVRRDAKLDVTAQEIIATLHAKYFKHSFYKPCTCSGKTWQQWISQLNNIYDNGFRENP